VTLSAAILFTALSQVVLADSVALSADCQDELNQLWSNYTNPAYTFPECDSVCLAECKETIETAMYVTDIKSCPLQTDITRCLGYYAPQWEDYVNECALFTVDTSGSVAGSTGEAEGEAGTAPPAPPVDAEAEAAAPTTDAEAAAEAEAPAPAEAEAEAPTSDESEAEAPAPAEETEAEAEAAAVGRRRRLLEAEAEAAASSGTGICFPTFQSEEEFAMYIKGEYFDLAYDPPSDTVGIILSTFFWVGLAALGFHLRK
jgi:hypothetical protein